MTVLLFTIQNWASRAQTAIFLKMALARLLGYPKPLGSHYVRAARYAAL